MWDEAGGARKIKCDKTWSSLEVAKFLFRQGNVKVVNRHFCHTVRVLDFTDGFYYPGSHGGMKFSVQLLIIFIVIKKVIFFLSGKATEKFSVKMDS